MQLQEIATLVALPVSMLSLAIACWSAWFNRAVKITEIRSGLSKQYAEILRRLEDVTELYEEFNQLCAAQSVEASIPPEKFRGFVRAAQDALREMENLPSRKVLGRYQRHSHHTENLINHIAKVDEHLRKGMKNLKQGHAP